MFSRIGPRISWIAVAGLSAWNLTLIANFAYVIRTDHDLGYLGLVLGQLPALHYAPRLFAQGAVVRELLSWRVPHLHFNAVHAIMLMTAEVACVGAAVWAAAWRARIHPPAAATDDESVTAGQRSGVLERAAATSSSTRAR